MTERSIAGRPTLEQVTAIVDFMEQHPVLAMGQLRSTEGRNESKKLWLKLTRLVNNINGPERTMKSWVKFWADKKTTIRSKVISGGGDPNILCSNLDKRIYDLFLADDPGNRRSLVKLETHFADDNFFTDNSNEDSEGDATHPHTLVFDVPPAPVDADERQILLMEKLVTVMGEQATALAQMAHATQATSQAMERLAEASHIQSRAIERLATTFETIGSTAHDISTTIVDIDNTMKRFYNTSTT